MNDNFTLYDLIDISYNNTRYNKRLIYSYIKDTLTNFTSLSFNDFLMYQLNDKKSLDNDYNLYLRAAGNSSLKEILKDYSIQIEELKEKSDSNEGFILALNMNVEQIQGGMNYIIENLNNISIINSFKHLGFDFTPIFHIYDRLLDIIKKGTNYTFNHWFREFVYQPPQLVDKLMDAERAIYAKNKFTYTAIENYFLSLIHLATYSFQSGFTFVFNVLSYVLKPLSMVYDFNSRSPHTRINDAINNLDCLISTTNSSEKEIYEYIKQILLDLDTSGFNFTKILDDHIIYHLNVLKEFTDPKASIFKACSDTLSDTDFGKLIGLLFKILDVLKKENGKILEIKTFISSLPESWFNSNLKSSVEYLYNIVMKTFPSEVNNWPIIDWDILHIGEDTLNSLLEMAKKLKENYNRNFCSLFNINKLYFVQAAGMISTYIETNVDTFDLASDILGMSEFASYRNVSFFVKTIKLSASRTFGTLTRLRYYTAFPFYLMLDAFSSKLENYHNLFNKEKTPITEFLRTINPKYLRILDVLYAVFKDAKSYFTVKQLLSRVPFDFLDVPATIDNIYKLTEQGITAEHITFPQLASCISIKSNIANPVSFEDLIPLKAIAHAAKVLNETNENDLTTSVVADAFGMNVDKVKDFAHKAESTIASEKVSLSNIIKTFSDFDLTNSFASVSNLVGRILSKEKITANDIEATVRIIIEDANHHKASKEIPKGLNTGAIVGIIAACVFAAVAITALITYILMRNRRHNDYMKSEMSLPSCQI